METSVSLARLLFHYIILLTNFRCSCKHMVWWKLVISISFTGNHNKLILPEIGCIIQKGCACQNQQPWPFWCLAAVHGPYNAFLAIKNMSLTGGATCLCQRFILILPKVWGVATYPQKVAIIKIWSCRINLRHSYWYYL